MTSKTNRVTNTSAEVNREPIVGLATAMVPGGIEASERRGQIEFLESEVLPAEIQQYWPGAKKGDGKLLLEAWGFVFGKHVGGDTLFMQAKLPPGWSRKGTDHAMWSHVVDDKGRERCAIFYKAAFYDRRATLSISPRYRFEHEYENPHDPAHMRGPLRGVIKEGETVLFAGPWRKDEPTEGVYVAYDAARKEADEWRHAHLPAGMSEQWAAP